MFGRSKSQPADQPPDVSTTTLAGAAALGGDGGSGMVSPWSAIPTLPLVPGSSHMTVVQSVQLAPDLTPDSYYADRSLYGGVATLSSFHEFREEAAFQGGYRVMGNRPPLVLVESEQMGPGDTADTSWRDAPPVVSMCRSIPSILTSGGFTGLGSVS